MKSKLIKRAQSGSDPIAVTMVLEEARSLFHSCLRRRHASPDLVDDAAQEALLRLLKLLAEARLDPKKNVDAFLARLVWWTYLDLYRRRQQTCTESDCGQNFRLYDHAQIRLPAGDEMDFPRLRLIQALRQAVQRLPGNKRKLCDLFLRGNSQTRIARLLRISISSVSKLLANLRRDIRQSVLWREKLVD